MDLLSFINGNQGLFTLGLLVVIVEMRVHMRHVFRRLDALEDRDDKC